MEKTKKQSGEHGRARPLGIDQRLGVFELRLRRPAHVSSDPWSADRLAADAAADFRMEERKRRERQAVLAAGLGKKAMKKLVKKQESY